MDTLCASSQTSIACRCRDTMHSTAGFTRLTPETLKAINDLVVQAAVELGTGGRPEACASIPRLVQTDIHFSDRQHVLIWGCHSRRHALDRSTRRGAWDAGVSGVSEIGTRFGAAPDARASTDDRKAASRSSRPRHIAKLIGIAEEGHRKRTRPHLRQTSKAGRQKTPSPNWLSRSCASRSSTSAVWATV